MGRLGLGVASVALALLSACGSGDGDDGADAQQVRETEAPAQIEFADACPKIQDALDASFDREALINSAEQYNDFADTIETLQVNDDAYLLEDLNEASRAAAKNADNPDATPGENLDSESDWLDAMDDVTSKCESAGAPLG